MTTGEDWLLTVVPDAPAMSAMAAGIVADVVRTNPEAVISLPTGSTPLGMFDILAAYAARGEVDFSRIHLFCLDEYVGVTPDDPNSLTGWLRAAFIDRVGIAPDRLHALPATTPDLLVAAEEYEKALEKLGGLDLAVLGLGPNGHIAYNEPGSGVDTRTRAVKLTRESREQARAYWAGQLPVPERALTIGVSTLLESKQIVLIVTGEAKADMLRRTLREPMSREVPASWLRLAGPRLRVIADEPAASALNSLD
jgi:glucosamine-6-phosphate deaminase